MDDQPRARTATTRTLDRSEWKEFCDHASRLLAGKRTEVAIAAPSLGNQIEAEWVPLLGITYDPREDMFELALDGLDHRISKPRQLSVQQGSDGSIASLLVIDASGAQQIVRFRDPLLLGPPAAAR